MNTGVPGLWYDILFFGGMPVNPLQTIKREAVQGAQPL
jgi:hypothetical protein